MQPDLLTELRRLQRAQEELAARQERTERLLRTVRGASVRRRLKDAEVYLSALLEEGRTSPGTLRSPARWAELLDAVEELRPSHRNSPEWLGEFHRHLRVGLTDCRRRFEEIGPTDPSALAHLNTLRVKLVRAGER